METAQCTVYRCIVYFSLKINSSLVDKSCYHSTCHTIVINEVSVFLISNSCAAVDPSFIELDSISQLQILLKIDPTNATRIELLAIRLLFRLHIRRTKLLELDVKRWFQCVYFPYMRYLFQYWVTHESSVYFATWLIFP
jgi:hypothetical protein